MTSVCVEHMADVTLVTLQKNPDFPAATPLVQQQWVKCGVLVLYQRLEELGTKQSFICFTLPSCGYSITRAA